MLPTPAARASQSVLIVDESDDAREVLRTVLAHRGVQIWEAEDEADGLRMAREVRPDVIVFDIDGDNASDAICNEYAIEAARGDASLVLLGTLRRAQTTSGEFVAKPYQYAPLILRIEQLLEQAPRLRRRAA
ncbi:MAG: hypothetical protein KDA41_07025 [Planctomycetales bacterium]|nr:hypothetical protein [Planctomycetales bacterium]